LAFLSKIFCVLRSGATHGTERARSERNLVARNREIEPDLPAPGVERLDPTEALAAKYPVLQGLLVPAFQRLTRKTTVHYVLLPSDAA
jgi:hypothetical protein